MTLNHMTILFGDDVDILLLDHNQPSDLIVVISSHLYNKLNINKVSQKKPSFPPFDRMAPTQRLTLDPSNHLHPTRDHTEAIVPSSLPDAKEIKVHPTVPGSENASLYFVGTATTILEWAGVRLMTDPNFLYEMSSLLDH